MINPKDDFKTLTDNETGETQTMHYSDLYSSDESRLYNAERLLRSFTQDMNPVFFFKEIKGHFKKYLGGDDE